MQNIKEMMKNGFFYNLPNEGCIKEIFYDNQEDKFGIQTYLYGKIIDAHQNTATDEEFESYIMTHSDNSIEYHSNDIEYNKINKYFENPEINPDFIGLSRAIMYSLAMSNTSCRDCNHCLHCEHCKAMNLSANPIKSTDCRMFIERDLMSEKTKKLLRVHYVNEFGHFTNFDQFLSYCKNCSVDTELLKSLDINYIVFVQNEGRCNTLVGSHGHAQVYATEGQAKDYFDSIVKIRTEEGKIRAIRNSFNVINSGIHTVISYTSRFGKESCSVSMIKIC